MLVPRAGAPPRRLPGRVLQALRAQASAPARCWRGASGAARRAAVTGDGRTAATVAAAALHARRSRPEWVDYNGHAHESRYLQVFGDATDGLLRLLGVDPAYLEAGDSYFTVETHLSHLGEARAGDRAARSTTQLLGADAKRLHIFHAWPRPASGADRHRRAAAAARDTGAGRAAAGRGTVLDRVLALAPRPRGAAAAGAGGQRHPGSGFGLTLSQQPLDQRPVHDIDQLVGRRQPCRRHRPHQRHRVQPGRLGGGDRRPRCPRSRPPDPVAAPAAARPAAPGRSGSPPGAAFPRERRPS